MTHFTDAEQTIIGGEIANINAGIVDRAAFMDNTNAVLALYKTAYSASQITGDNTEADALRRRVMMRDEVALRTRPTTTVQLDTEYTIAGPWQNDRYGYDPERIIRYVTFFQADYYGTGMHTYARGYSRVEYTSNGQLCLGPKHAAWQDGNNASVEDWMRRV